MLSAGYEIKRSAVEDSLKQVLESRKSSTLVPILNIVAKHGPLTFEDVIKHSGMPKSTVFDALDVLVDTGIIFKVTKKLENPDKQGRPSITLFSTVYRIGQILEKKEELAIGRLLRVDAFDLVMLAALSSFIGLFALRMFDHAIGIAFILPVLFIYYMWFKIFKRGRWAPI